MLSKIIYLRDMKSNDQFHIVKKSYDLAALNDQKWYVQGTKKLFDQEVEILNQLDGIRAGDYIRAANGEKLYAVIFGWLSYLMLKKIVWGSSKVWIGMME